MWAPGTLLYVPGQRVGRILGMHARLIDGVNGIFHGELALVISTHRTGFGSKGVKWDSLVLAGDRLVTVKEAWRQHPYVSVYYDALYEEL